MELVTAQGMRMPKLGFGTWQLQGDICRQAVSSALGLGYRHVDTAELYENEEAVGAGIADSGVSRDQIHITSKVSHRHLDDAAMRQALDGSLRRLNTDYLDLYLIHWPLADVDMRGPLESLMRLRETGKVRAIGVSNFPVALLKLAVEDLGAPIACNQVEYHPLLAQTPVLDYARAHDMCVAAYSPLARGKAADQPELQRVARKYNVTATQIALAWLLRQDGVVPIPKAARRENQQANLAALDIRLDAEDLALIASAPKDQRLINPPWAPQWDYAR